MSHSVRLMSGVAFGFAISVAAGTFGCSGDEPTETTASPGGLPPGGSTPGESSGSGGSAPSTPSASGGSSSTAASTGTEGPPVPATIDTSAGGSGNASNENGSAGDSGEVESPAVADAGLPPDEAVPPAFSPCPTDGSACRIMPLGDSITDGLVGVGPGNTQAANGGYRVELFRLANTDGHEVTFVGTRGPNGPNQVDGQPFPRDHEGISGDTIPGVAGRVDDAIAATSPDIVLLQIGTNHLYQGLPAGLTGQLGNLLDQITNDAPDALVVVAQITPLGASFPNNGVDEYNAAIPALVQERVDAGKHLLMVDMFDAISSSPTPLAQLVGDNIHPNAAGYVIMAQTWYAALESYLP